MVPLWVIIALYFKVFFQTISNRKPTFTAENWSCDEIPRPDDDVPLFPFVWGQDQVALGHKRDLLLIAPKVSLSLNKCKSDVRVTVITRFSWML